MTISLLLLFSYLLGSIPIGLLIGRLAGVDVRQHGSRNTGASNVWRTLKEARGPVWGPICGVATFALDVGKGLAPTLVARHLLPHLFWMPVAAGLLAIIGHNFSVFLGFRGGKGVATTLGVAFGLSWLAALLAFVVWALVLLVTRYISVASLVGTPIGALGIWAFNGWNWAYGLFALLATVFVFVKHRANIGRLRAGTEPKVGTRKVA
jgi:glycerol-3-phosphate acyltransferase PlsY